MNDFLNVNVDDAMNVNEKFVEMLKFRLMKMPRMRMKVIMLHVLSATFILSKNSRVLDAKSRLKSANLS